MTVPLLDLAVKAPGRPVFVTGGPPRTPFAGQGRARWDNPAFSLHHAKSWGSAFVLGPMAPLAPAALPGEPAGERFLGRQAATAAELGRSGLPFVAQIWGPLTLASTRVGLTGFLEGLAFPDSAALGDMATEGLTAGTDAAIAAARAVLGTAPAILWVAEPLAVLLGQEMLERVWVAPMRRLVAEARAAGVHPVIHMSGAATHVLPLIDRIGASGVSLTADTPLAAAREALASHTVVFGNLDSMRLLDRDAEWLAAAAREMVAVMRGRPFVATPGSALPDHLEVDRLAAFVDAARDAGE